MVYCHKTFKDKNENVYPCFTDEKDMANKSLAVGSMLSYIGYILSTKSQDLQLRQSCSRIKNPRFSLYKAVPLFNNESETNVELQSRTAPTNTSYTCVDFKGMLIISNNNNKKSSEVPQTHFQKNPH